MTGRPQASDSTGAMPKSSSAGSTQRPRGTIRIAQRSVRQRAEELDARAGGRPQPGFIRARADDLQPRARFRRRSNRHVDPLVRHESRDDEERPVRRARPVDREKLRIDRRMDDRRRTIIVPRDPPRNVRGVRDEAIDAGGGLSIPAREPPRHAPRRRARQPAEPFGSEIRLELIPDVPHWRVTVADVPRAAGRHDGLDRAMARREDEVHVVEIEELDSGGIEREIVTIPAAGIRKALHEGRADRTSLDERGH